MKLKETKRWHLLYYMQNCRRVQQVLGAYSVINNYLLEYFKIECGYSLITTFIQQIVIQLNNQYFNYLYIIPHV